MKNLHSQVDPIIRKAGQIVLGFFRKPLKSQIKAEHGSIVTEADLASEKFLIAELGQIIPQACFFAEESGKSGGKSEYCWVIDPLDGTTNFAHGLDYFGISVALTHHGKPIFGAIYRPVTDELFWAQEGQGAFLNGQKIAVSAKSGLEGALFSASSPYGRGKTFENAVQIREKVRRKSYGLRNFGSAAVDIAMVAVGRLDGAFFEDLGWWDVAAGMVIVQEAGGIATNYEGGTVDSEYRTFMVANKEVHKELLSLIKA